MSNVSSETIESIKKMEWYLTVMKEKQMTFKNFTSRENILQK